MIVLVHQLNKQFDLLQVIDFQIKVCLVIDLHWTFLLEWNLNLNLNLNLNSTPGDSQSRLSDYPDTIKHTTQSTHWGELLQDRTAIHKLSATQLPAENPRARSSEPSSRLHVSDSQFSQPAQADLLKDSPTLSISAGRCGGQFTNWPMTCCNIRRMLDECNLCIIRYAGNGWNIPFP